MIGALDFNMPGPLFAALILCVLQPFFLFAITRIIGMRGHTATQFLLSSAITMVLWVAAIYAIPALRPSGLADIAIGLMLLVGGTLAYLCLWGVLVRGYTLGVLLTLLKAAGPLTEQEIARLYRGGEGLDWIMRHRLGGLYAAGVVENRGGRLVLTIRGLTVAKLYQTSIVTLGLRRTG
jgi:hypothetical protein